MPFHIVSASSPVPSVVFSVLALLVISLGVLLILRYYLPLRTTPAFYLVPIFFALWLPACMVLLVPIDLASSARTEDEATRGVWLPDRVLLVSWRITYWLTFALTWFILPILGEYSDAGYREPKDNILYSLRENAQYHAIMLGSGAIGVTYAFISYGADIDSFKSVLMALAYFWGLIFAVYLMGHGLVSIPRRLLRFASVSGRLRRLQIKAPKVYERMEDSLMTLEDVEVQVTELSKRKVGTARDFAEWIDDLVEMADLPESRGTGTRASAESRIIPRVITEKYMADLTRNLVRARHKRSRYTIEWTHLVEDAVRTQAILDSAASKKLVFDAVPSRATFWDRWITLSPHTRYIIYYHVQPYASIILGVFLAGCSACIIWSELIKDLFPTLSVIRLTVVHHWVNEKSQVGFAGQTISVLWLLYMCAAAFITMTEVKTWRGRALVYRNTGYESAFWYAGQVAKLSVPLSYNYVTFLTADIYKQTRFHKFLGQYINLTSLGSWMSILFPLFVLVPVVATLFGLYGRVQRFFGFGVDIIDDEDDEGNQRSYGAGSWREGRDLIDRELNGNSAGRRREEALARLAGEGRSAPVLTIPGVRTGGASPARSPVRSAAPARRERGSRPQHNDQDLQEENFFESLGHRMKNTMDTFEAPKWFQDIQKPKWMGGDDDESNGAESDIRRWFGGSGGGGSSSGEGRIRL
ncbi:LMBR1 domain-containing protein [Plectosphaerella plurivora]|uniref:LMBR1 domain-containing protein n=1 Tax=Plectosphaerella plurivora TaxID=936078 RepID=A0A9P9AAZ3_9PEZI|nr:LMBR1 domain-containing protein [Plectosphaerella plurivora]